MSEPNNKMGAFMRVRRLSRSIAGASPHGEKIAAGCEVDCSVRTAEVDMSTGSMPRSERARASGSSLEGEEDGGPRRKSCMKVRTQRDSLDRISQLNLPSYAPTITEPFDVRFYTVEFRQYPIVLSDNPSTTSGPPIGIGWDHDPAGTVTLDVDQYEDERDREGSRRKQAELVIPKHSREYILRKAGYTREEIVQATWGANRSRKQRRASLEMQRFDPLLETVETMRRGVKRITPRRQSSEV